MAIKSELSDEQDVGFRPSAQECAQNGRARSTKCAGRLRHEYVLYAKNEDFVKRIKSIDSKTKNYYNKPIIKIC